VVKKMMEKEIRGGKKEGSEDEGKVGEQEDSKEGMKD
jgi:hypothetical protein